MRGGRPRQPRVLHGRAGDHERALHHLRVAAERDPTALEYAATDADLDAIRDDPRFPRSAL